MGINEDDLDWRTGRPVPPTESWTAESVQPYSKTKAKKSPPKVKKKEDLLIEGFIVISSIPSEALFNQSFREAFSDLISIRKSFPLFPRQFQSRLAGVRRDWYINVLSPKEVYRLGQGHSQVIVVPLQKSSEFLNKAKEITKRLNLLEEELLCYIESAHKWQDYIKEKNIKIRKAEEYLKFRSQFFTDLQDYGESFTAAQLNLLSPNGRAFILACQQGLIATKTWMKAFVKSLNLPGRFVYELIPLRLDEGFFEGFVKSHTEKTFKEMDAGIVKKITQAVAETRERLTAEAMNDVASKIEAIMEYLLEAAKKKKLQIAMKYAKRSMGSVKELTKGAFLSRRIRMIMADAETTLDDIDAGVEMPLTGKSARIQALINQIRSPTTK